jgi:DNA-binding NtrC family response regulator
VAKKSQPKLLFVDDEEELVSAVVERFEIRGIDGVGVTSGDEALQLLQREHFDVVLLDVKMPGVNGLDVLRTITRTYPDTKVILMTGHGSAEDIELGLRLGAAACLQKPVDLETLLEAARSAASGGEAADGEG